MKRSIVAYSVALCVAYGAAYFVWTHEAQSDLAEKVVILPGKPDELESVEFHTKDLDVAMTLEKDELGTYVWVRTTPLGDAAQEGVAEPEEPPADPHGMTPPKPEPEEPAEFKAGKAMDAVLEGLAPFVAKRTLENVDAAQLEELGLAPEPGRIVLHRKGKSAKTYFLGADVYGGANYYVQDPETSKVYIVDAAVLRPLFSASRSLPETTLVDAAMKDIERIEVEAGDARATFIQHHPDDPQAQFWSRAGSEEPDATAAAWIDKAMRLRASAYVPAGEHPATLEQAFAFTVVGDKPVRVTVFRALGENGEESWFAESVFTRSLVRLHPSMAAEATADLSSVLEVGAGA